MDDLFCLRQHLGLRDPKGGGGHGDGEVVDLDTIELLYADLNDKLPHHHLIAIQFLDGLVFHSPE